MSLKVLGLIPARGGSKGLPRKNLMPLAGKSLIERTYTVALESGVLDRIILSTDDPEIRDHAQSMGLESPFLRPARFADDGSPMIDVIIHALDALEQNGYIPDALMLLQPTSPLRTAQHLIRAVELLDQGDSVCSVVQVPPTHAPHYVMKIEGGRLDYFLEEGRMIKRRQDAPPAYTREGTVYLTRTEVIRTHRDLYGDNCRALLLDAKESLSIDTLEDWQDAERRLERVECA